MMMSISWIDDVKAGAAVVVVLVVELVDVVDVVVVVGAAEDSGATVSSVKLSDDTVSSEAAVSAGDDTQPAAIAPTNVAIAQRRRQRYIVYCDEAWA